LQVSPVKKVTNVNLLLRYKGWPQYEKRKKRETDQGFREIYKRAMEAYLSR
jgi:hypothetical protein